MNHPSNPHTGTAMSYYGMPKDEAREYLVQHPLHEEVTSLGKVAYSQGRLYTAQGFALGLASPMPLVRALRINKEMLKTLPAQGVESVIAQALVRNRARDVKIRHRDGRLIDIVQPEATHISSLELLERHTSQNVRVSVNGGTVSFIEPTALSVDAVVGDPVAVHRIMENHETGNQPGVDMSTLLLRLACENGAVVSSDMFSLNLAVKDLDEMAISFGTFADHQRLGAEKLAQALPAMTRKALGDDFNSFQKQHAALLGHQSFPDYGPDSSFWNAVNSVTESAKISKNRAKLEVFAGRTMERFIR